MDELKKVRVDYMNFSSILQLYDVYDKMMSSAQVNDNLRSKYAAFYASTRTTQMCGNVRVFRRLFI